MYLRAKDLPDMISRSFRDVRASYFNMKMRPFEQLIHLEDTSLGCRSNDGTITRREGRKSGSSPSIRYNFTGIPFTTR